MWITVLCVDMNHTSSDDEAPPSTPRTISLTSNEVAAAYVNDDNRHWLETYAYGFRGE